jgi:hypothetical protein
MRRVLFPGQNLKTKTIMEFDLRTHLRRLLNLAVTVAAGIPAVWSFLTMLKMESQVSVVCNGIYLLLGLYIFGIVCSVQYSGCAAESFVDFLLFPKKFLKKPTPLLSIPQALLASGRAAEAECELLRQRSQHPGSPELALMLADLHAGHFNDPEAAIADCRFYFDRRCWRYHELNCIIVLRYADWQSRLGRKNKALDRLVSEARASFYSRADKKALLARAESLRQECSKE